MPKIKTSTVNVYLFRLTPIGPQYLALHRRKEIDRLGGTWQSVHGGIEDGETASQAATRELREETGLQLVSLWALDHVEAFYVYQQDAIVLAPCFGAEVEGEVTLSGEHDKFQWLSLEEIKKRLLWREQIESIEILHNQIAMPLFENKRVNLLLKIDSVNY